ncbi:MAG: sensor histidine kinase, partial [Bacteroidota bacterium]
VVDITHQKEIERNLRRANDILANTIAIRKQAEEDLRNALEKEKELAELKSRLVSMTSHEFRTPLTTIQTNSEILAIKLKEIAGENSEKIEKHLNRILNEVAKLTRLMDDILLMGRYESGKIVFQPTELNLTELITDILASKKHMEGDDREIVLQTTGAHRPFVGDPTLLSHAFTNVVNNSLKYSKGCASPVAELRYEDEGAVFTLQDFGIGIPEGEKPKLFDTFYRATNVTNIQGTGMGLVIVKQFIEMHKGTVTLDSIEGHGTTVTFRLPYLPAPLATEG